MKKDVLKLIMNLSAASLLVPQLVYGYDLIQPQIKNNGEYMQLASEKKMRFLYGHVLNTDGSNAVAPLAKDKILKLSIVLALNNEKQLDEKLLAITDPNHSDYQHFLSQSEFIDQYAPTSEQVKNVNEFLTKNGMHVESISSNRIIIQASGSVATIEKIFNTKLFSYIDKKGTSYYAPAYELQVDNNLNIISVLGLENRIKAHPNYKVLKNNLAGATKGLTPANIKTAYSITSNLNGSGQTLALFELDGYTASDITAYEKAYNLPQVPLQNILVDGVTGKPSSSDGPGEVTLDIELMAALAPGASKILVYEGPNSTSGLVDTYNRIATDNLSKSISTSWGLDEKNAGSIVQAENPIFKQMVAQGQILYAAAGDAGAYDDGKNLGIDDPSSQPFVVAVGGTRLTTNTNGSYASETTWASGNGPGGQGGGGGISSVWSIPQWQQGVIKSGSLGSTTMRNTPDLALDADPNTGYAIYYKGQWNVYGGTSCAAPLWAAFTGLVNQQRSTNGQAALGFPNPTIYALGQSANYAATMHDIKDNSTNLHYPAIQGYDLATGWGSFIGDALINNLANNSNPAPTCTHANPTVSISPASQQSPAGKALSYQVNVTNNDTVACTASTFNLAAVVPSGFSNSLSQSSLNVSPGSNATASIQVTSGLSAPAGNYSFSVSAVNTGASTYNNTGSATYVVSSSQSQYSLSVDPQNASFPYNSYQYAKFKFTLMSGKQVLPYTTINLSVTGPQISWSTSFSTGYNGEVKYYIYLNQSIPRGNYLMNATAQYNGHPISGGTRFTIN